MKISKATALLRGRRRRTFLESLPKQAVVAEIGALRGHFSREIMRVAEPRELHLVDVWWELFGDVYPDWGPETRHGTLTTRAAHEEVSQLARDYERDNGALCRVHVGDDRVVLKEFADHHFDWVYVDSSHEYEHTRQELELLRTKVKPDGIIAGHDWFDDPDHPHHGVRRAIGEFCAEHGWRVRGRDVFSQWAIEPSGG